MEVKLRPSNFKSTQILENVLQVRRAKADD